MSNDTLPPADLLSQVLQASDLSVLSADARVEYYKAMCEIAGLNPLTRPFEFMSLSGKTVLYAKKECTDRIRAIHNINVKILHRDIVDGLCIVTAQAVLPSGRQDESIGATSLVHPQVYQNKNKEWVKHPKAGEPLDAVLRANSVMKSETKAKRRVTLSIVGLGVLDESEVADATPFPNSQPETAAPLVQGLTLKSTENPPPGEAKPAAQGDSAAGGAVETKPIETRQYVDGTSATGTAPLPDQSPGEQIKAKQADASPPAATDTGETGEALPAHRVKVFEAKMDGAKITPEQFKTKFGRELKSMLKTDSSRIQAFIDNPNA